MIVLAFDLLYYLSLDKWETCEGEKGKNKTEKKHKVYSLPAEDFSH